MKKNIVSKLKLEDLSGFYRRPWVYIISWGAMIFGSFVLEGVLKNFSFFLFLALLMLAGIDYLSEKNAVEKRPRLFILLGFGLCFLIIFYLFHFHQKFSKELKRHEILYGKNFENIDDLILYDCKGGTLKGDVDLDNKKFINCTFECVVFHWNGAPYYLDESDKLIGGIALKSEVVTIMRTMSLMEVLKLTIPGVPSIHTPAALREKGGG